MGVLTHFRDSIFTMIMMLIILLFAMVLVMPTVYILVRWGLVLPYLGTARIIATPPVLAIITVILLVATKLALSQSPAPFYLRRGFKGALLMLFIITFGVTWFFVSIGQDVVGTIPNQCSNPCILNSIALVGGYETASWNVDLKAGQQLRMEIDVDSYGLVRVHLSTSSRGFFLAGAGDIPGQLRYMWDLTVASSETHILRIMRDDSGVTKLQVKITEL